MGSKRIRISPWRRCAWLVRAGLLGVVMRETVRIGRRRRGGRMVDSIGLTEIEDLVDRTLGGCLPQIYRK